MTTAEKLDLLARYRADREQLVAQLDARINAILTDAAKRKIATAQADAQAQLDATAAQISQLESEIKAEVLDHGKTVSGALLQAVLQPGRVTWDDRALHGYAVDHPDILAFRRSGSATVSIRARAGS